MKYFKIQDFEVLEIRMQLRTKMFHLEEKKWTKMQTYWSTQSSDLSTFGLQRL